MKKQRGKTKNLEMKQSPQTQSQHVSKIDMQCVPPCTLDEKTRAELKHFLSMVETSTKKRGSETLSLHKMFEQSLLSIVPISCVLQDKIEKDVMFFSAVAMAQSVGLIKNIFVVSENCKMLETCRGRIHHYEDEYTFLRDITGHDSSFFVLFGAENSTLQKALAKLGHKICVPCAENDLENELVAFSYKPHLTAQLHIERHRPALRKEETSMCLQYLHLWMDGFHTYVLQAINRLPQCDDNNDSMCKATPTATPKKPSKRERMNEHSDLETPQKKTRNQCETKVSNSSTSPQKDVRPETSSEKESAEFVSVPLALLNARKKYRLVVKDPSGMEHEMLLGLNIQIPVSLEIISLTAVDGNFRMEMRQKNATEEEDVDKGENVGEK